MGHGCRVDPANVHSFKKKMCLSPMLQNLKATAAVRCVLVGRCLCSVYQKAMHTKMAEAVRLAEIGRCCCSVYQKAMHTKMAEAVTHAQMGSATAVPIRKQCTGGRQRQ